MPRPQEKTAHEEERVSLFRDRERLNKELNRLVNERESRGGGASGEQGGGSPAESPALAFQVDLACPMRLRLRFVGYGRP